MKVKSLATLQQIWVPGSKLIARRTWNKSTDLTKNGLLMNVHVKEMGNVIMWTICNFNKILTQILAFPQTIYKTAIKTRKPDYNTSLTHTCINNTWPLQKAFVILFHMYDKCCHQQ